MTKAEASLPENLALSRQDRLLKLKQENWDLIIIGGGITGAGIFHQACKIGLNALLLEQKDFAWGSSSRSSKMVHGGLRYIAQGQIKLTKESVQERQLLIENAPGLVSSHSFAMSHYQHQFPGPFIFNQLLNLYDFLAGQKQHHYWTKQHYPFLAPGLKEQDSLGGSQFVDAITDDARLVLRLIQEGQALGGLAINYIKVNELRIQHQKVIGVLAQETHITPDHTANLPSYSLSSHAVINATGPWAETLSKPFQKEASKTALKIRPLRGSHLIVHSWRLPVASVICILHPKDQRPVQVFPWQNMTVIGTTDVEHNESLENEPRISQAEYDYLLAAIRHQFPQANIRPEDIVSTFSGIRPIVESQSLIERFGLASLKRKKAPSKEKRDHSIFHNPGFITVAGGKLTTFRVIANQVLLTLSKELNLSPQSCLELKDKDASFKHNKTHNHLKLASPLFERLEGQYGPLTPHFLALLEPALMRPFGYSNKIAGEILWALKHEQVMHLDDLLLRRTRLGNILPNGGLGYLDKIKDLCIKELGWSQDKWQDEVSRYQTIWTNHYSLPTKD